MSTKTLEDLEPRGVWRRFAELTRIPRPSRHEEEAVAWAREIARANGWTVRADPAGNLALDVPASPGLEDAPIVTLQGHLDMVCEKNEGVDHEFETDPIATEIGEDGWVRASGTTLGADNGLGVAMAIAAAEDPEAVHGPLEILLTLDEETGLNGALKLDPALVRGRILLNLDTEEDDAIYIGCAGSAGTVATLPLERDRLESGREHLTLGVRGLRGGHSGMDVRLGRANAIGVAAEVVDALRRAGLDVRILSWRGGGKRNAIPRESFVELSLAPGEGVAAAATVSRLAEELRGRFEDQDPDLALRLEPSGGAGGTALTVAGAARLVDLLLAAPHGILAMSRRVEGLVETSINLASVDCDDAAARIEWSYRSSVTRALVETARSLAGLCRLAGAAIEEDAGYPGWVPRPDAPLIRRTVEVWRDATGEAPAVRAVHAGLECGILVDRIPGMQAVSMGPDIRDAHSPHERARIASVGRVQAILLALLADLAREPLGA